MIAGTVAELLNELGVAKSHCRPRVSNDNPFIESHFKTLKYRPDYPTRFDSITARPHLVPFVRPLVQRDPLPLRHRLPPPRRPPRRQPHRHRRAPPTTLDAAAAAHPQRFTRATHPTQRPHQSLDQPTNHPIRIETRQPAIDRFRTGQPDRGRRGLPLVDGPVVHVEFQFHAEERDIHGRLVDYWARIHRATGVAPRQFVVALAPPARLPGQFRSGALELGYGAVHLWEIPARELLARAELQPTGRTRTSRCG